MGEIRRIYKVGEGRIVDGVCAGIAKYWGIEPLWVRIGWVALGLLGGIGVVVYIVAMAIFPRTPDTEPPLSDARSRRLIGALILAFFGLFFLLTSGIGRYDFWAPWRVAWYIFLPLSLIAGGGVILLTYEEQTSHTRVLRRSLTDRKFLGVCGGLGSYFEKDPNLIRFVFATVTILSRGVGILVYVIMALLLGEESKSQDSPV